MLTTDREKQMLVGLTVQPFVAAAVGLVLFRVVNDSGGPVGVDSLTDFEAALAFGVLCGAAASFVTGLVGYPGLVWVLKRRNLTRQQTLIGGLLLGNIPGALMVLALAARHLSRGVTPTLDNLTYGLDGALRLISYGTVIGVAGAAVFWWVAGRRLNAHLS
jgi:hypothetical protein